MACEARDATAVSGTPDLFRDRLPVDARAVRAAQIFNVGGERPGSARALRETRWRKCANRRSCERPSTILPVAGTTAVYPPSQIAKRRACVLERGQGRRGNVFCPRSRRAGSLLCSHSARRMPRHSQAFGSSSSCRVPHSALSKDTDAAADPPSNPMCVSRRPKE